MARIEKNVLLSRKTTFRIGGRADIIVRPETIEEIVEWIVKEEIKIILGGGSNILVSDKGVRGVLLNMGRAFRNVEIVKRENESEKILVRAKSGVSLTRLSVMAMSDSLAGLEFGFGIPGSLGGALVMNAGAHEGEMKDIVESVTLVTADGEIKTLKNDECGFEYRASRFPAGSLLVEATLRLIKGERKKIEKRMKAIYMRRKSTQPLNFPSAGSIFKNPEGDYAGRLIENAGLKGLTTGGARISDKHANFIVNTGKATARDVLALIERIEKEVLSRFGVKLKREIKLVGEF